MGVTLASPKILAIETHSKDKRGIVRTSAIDHYRLISPLSHAGVNVEFWKDVVREGESPDEAYHKTRDFDIVYTSYIDAPTAYAYMKASIDLNGQKQVMDLDDNLFEVDELSPVYDRYHPGSENKFYAHQIIKDAEVVTVTNENLKRVLIENGREKPTYVLPNYIDLDLYKMGNKKKPDKKINIFYQGSATHYSDLTQSGLYEALRQIFSEYGKRVNFYSIGMPVDILEDTPRYKFISGRGDFFEWLELWKRELSRADIAVAPVLDTSFNDCKSPIKYFEYAASLTPGIYSDNLPYKGTVAPGAGILTQNTPDGWYKSIKAMIESKDLRDKIRLEAYEDVRRNWTIQKHAYKWRELVERIYGN